MTPQPAPDPSLPVRRLKVIGIGAGDPSLVTAQAAAAMAAVDVFLTLDKGPGKADLAAARAAVLARFGGPSFRVLSIADGARQGDLGYDEAVTRWHGERVAAIEEVLLTDVDPGETAAILVWGDPALYDSTLRIIEQLNDRGRLVVQYEVFPGISSVQLLAARHRIALNRIGAPVLITTGRRLREGLPEGIDDAVVMLDGESSFTTLVGAGYEIFWGAYLGSVDELLAAGPLDEVAGEIVRVRAEARAAKGWMFDIYLVRRLRGHAAAGPG